MKTNTKQEQTNHIKEVLTDIYNMENNTPLSELIKDLRIQANNYNKEFNYNLSKEELISIVDSITLKQECFEHLEGIIADYKQDLYTTYDINLLDIIKDIDNIENQEQLFNITNYLYSNSYKLELTYNCEIDKDQTINDNIIISITVNFL